jgi:hypothetical protein
MYNNKPYLYRRKKYEENTPYFTTRQIFASKVELISNIFDDLLQHNALKLQP